MLLPRSLATRNTSEGMPSRGAITATFENKIRAVGRANLAKMSPVISAVNSMLHRDSSVTTVWQYESAGTILPYPIVAIV